MTFPMIRPLLLFLLGTGSALACGPWLTLEQMQDRQTALRSLGAGTFSFEVMRMVSRDPRQPPAFDYQNPDSEGLTEAAASQIRMLRAQQSLSAAEALSVSALSEADRAYTLGAVAWHRGEPDAAARYFTAVLALPESAQERRGLAAHWMMARLAAMAAQWRRADRHLAALRAARLAGAPDPYGLYWSSLGEQARNALAQADFGRAIALYARQATHGEQVGVESLLLVARRLVSNPAELQSAIADPMVRRLLTIYFYTRGGEWFDPYPEHGVQAGDGTQLTTQRRQLLEAVRAGGVTTLEGADRVAAVAYQAGDYAFAAELIRLAEHAPLALWIGAKLKFRDGDIAGAEAALAEASRAFPVDEIWDDPVWYAGDYVPKPVCDLAAERSLLRLSQGDYARAAELLLRAGEDYWSDLAYVAERVLDLDQLQQLVAAHPAPHTRPWEHAEDRRSRQAWAVIKLRDLAARRLLRGGRDAAAIRLFTTPELRALAVRYAQARQHAQSSHPIVAARGWFAAASIVRTHGSELLGRDTWVDPAQAAAPPLLPARELERRRQVAEPPPFDAQDGTRYIALDHLERAAALLPPRSQAFAAVLCRATAWSIHYDPPLGRQWYARYLRDGAYVPWGTQFGRGPSDGSACPLPDFDKLSREREMARLRELMRGFRPWLWPVLVLALLLVGWRLQTRAKRPQSPPKQASVRSITAPPRQTSPS